MEFRTCRRVLQVRLFLRENVVACPECRQSAFVKARENQFFLPRVNVAVTDGTPGDVNLSHLSAGFVKARDLSDFKLHFPVFAQRFHLGNRRIGRAKSVATVNQNDTFCFADEVERPVQSRVAAAADYDVLTGENVRIPDTVVQLRALELFDSRNAQGARLERTDARGDDDHLTQKLRSLACFDIKASVRAFRDVRHFLAQVENRVKGVNLL